MQKYEKEIGNLTLSNKEIELDNLRLKEKSDNQVLKFKLLIPSISIFWY